MAEPNEIIHQPLRLKIMAALWAQREREPLEFPLLKRITAATDGNLGSHLNTLHRAGYITLEKEPVGARQRTRVALTPEGKTAFRRHIDYLREVIEGSTD